MSAAKGYYSIIQYCPDLSRFEAANVGVLLFCPERRFLKALTSRGNSRIIRFFGSEGHDWKRINAFKQGLEDRLQAEASEIRSVDDLRQFIALRANVIQITPPNPMKVFEPEQDLRELYQRVMGEPAARPARKSLRRYVGEKLSSAGLDSKVARNIRLTVPVLEKELEFPFGFQNGRFNLINPVRFLAQDPDQSLSTACRYAVEGQSLFEHPDPELGELQLILVAQFRPEDRRSPELARRVFDKYRVRLFRTDELPQLIDEIRRTGREIEARPESATPVAS